MLNSLALFPFVILTGIIIYLLFKALVSEDKREILSPIFFISLILLYYVIMPIVMIRQEEELLLIEDKHVFYWVALLFFVCILIGFSIKSGFHFTKWNTVLTEKKAVTYAVILFLLMMLIYVPVRGFRYTIAAEDASGDIYRGGLTAYLAQVIAFGCAICGLMYMGVKNNKKPLHAIVFIIILYITLVAYIVTGFRYKIVWLLIVLYTVYQAYPKPRRINILLVGIIGVVTYIGFGIMDYSRNYGKGLDMNGIEEYEDNDILGSKENISVCSFSIKVVNFSNETGDRIGVEPILTAVLMPIPRSWFSSKPDGAYLKYIQRRLVGNDSEGKAFLSFAEAFWSFGWLGVIIYGLLLGFLSRIFWGNYCDNPDSIGAILLLALFNGFCFQWISRGYLAANVNQFIYFVILPFVFFRLFKLFSK